MKKADEKINNKPTYASPTVSSLNEKESAKGQLPVSCRPAGSSAEECVEGAGGKYFG